MDLLNYSGLKKACFGQFILNIKGVLLWIDPGRSCVCYNPRGTLDCAPLHLKFLSYQNWRNVMTLILINTLLFFKEKQNLLYIEVITVPLTHWDMVRSSTNNCPILIHVKALPSGDKFSEQVSSKCHHSC